MISDNIAFDLIAAAVTFLAGFVIYYKWCFTYWKRRGLEYLEPSIPFGNMGKLFLGKSSISEQFAEIHKELKNRNLKHGGAFMFGRPFYVPTDPVIIKNILQNDFSHFVDRGFYVNEENDPLSGTLFGLEGHKWKNLRAKLTATFTSGKMKMMFETMTVCAEELEKYISQPSIVNYPVDIKNVLALFTTDNITSCAFGLESNCLKNPDVPIRHFGKRAVEDTTWESLKTMLTLVLPRKIMDVIKYKTSKPDVEEFIMDLVKKTVDYREKNNIFRKDFLHLLLQIKNRGKLSDDDIVVDQNVGSKEIGLTMNELAAQVFVFFVGGYETSATTMTFTLYELSRNQDIQNKLREEIKGVLAKHNNEITYDAIMEMTYMDQVINEALRKHPPLGILNRICTETYKMPNTSFTIEKGTMVGISILGLHHDPEYYPEPSKFDPDRFSKENKNKRPQFTWMPFGEGPRICIGLRFGMLQTKLGLTTLLKSYKIALNSKTKTPLVMDKKSIITTSETGIWLDLTKLE